MIHLHFHDSKPIPRLAETIAKQKKLGGRLVLYRRAWSALVVTMTQDRIEHVPFDRSRMVAGWRHDLFTLAFGIWSPAGLVSMPLLLILNLRGGMDVTAQFSQASIDPLHALPPDPGQAKRDLLIAQWTFVVLGLAVIAAVFVLFVGSPFPK
jgi:hypothetical protein